MDSTLTLCHVYTAMCIHEPDYCGLGVLGFEVRQLHALKAVWMPAYLNLTFVRLNYPPLPYDYLCIFKRISGQQRTAPEIT